MKEFTDNGMEFTWRLSGPDGADFVLWPEPHHTREDIREAKRSLRRNRDVTGIRLANDSDYYHRFRSQVFTHPLTKHLHWSQIDFEYDDWAENKDITPKQFIDQHLNEWSNNIIPKR